MDSEWVIRAGILAVAVVLMAPTIIGLERVRRAVTIMMNCGERPAVFFPIGLFLAAATFTAVHFLVVTYPPLGSAVDIPVLDEIIVGLLLVVVMLLLFLVSMLPLFALLLAERLMTGPENLRVLVFGIGFVLLVAGSMAVFDAAF